MSVTDTIFNVWRPTVRVADSAVKMVGTIAGIGAVGFVGGAIYAAIAGSPVLLTGIVVGVRSATALIFTYAFAHIGRALEWSLEGAHLLAQISNVLSAVAMLVAGIALGIFGPVGIILGSAIIAENVYHLIQAADAYNDS